MHVKMMPKRRVFKEMPLKNNAALPTGHTRNIKDEMYDEWPGLKVKTDIRTHILVYGLYWNLRLKRRRYGQGHHIFFIVDNIKNR